MECEKVPPVLPEGMSILASSGIVLVPFGEVEKEVLIFLKGELAKKFPYPVSLHFPLPLPADSFNTRRKQYSSHPFLEELHKLPDDAFRFLGITGVDLYVRGLNFIFGQAELAGKAAIISLARLREGFYGREEDLYQLQLRSLKEAVHELGHTLGLKHCRNFPCVMMFSNTLMEVDKRSSDFCPSCESMLSDLTDSA